MLFVLAAVSFITLVIYALKLRLAIQQAPHLEQGLSERRLQEERGVASSESVVSTQQASIYLSGKISVIIPAYNEAANVMECLSSVLASRNLPDSALEIWLIDDQSTDETLAIALSLQQSLHDPRLKVLAGRPRPEGEVWVGKNWACVQAVEQATGDFLLFIDADVRLQPGAIAATVQAMDQQQIDLLSFGPAILCGCLAEWLVQPLMFSIILVGFNFAKVNDPKTDTAFAAGPFMCFRRTAYEAIGGHRAVGDQVVEDVELARRIKAKGLKLRFLSGSEWVAVRMYQSWRSLWEGWTKNLYLGSQRNFPKTVLFIGLILLLCTVPWGVLLGVGLKGWLWGWAATDSWTAFLSLMAIALHYDLRRVGEQESKIPPRYWWLTGVGGLIVAAIAIASIIKTETGWGWTWRGRQLKRSLPISQT
jgi:hypothetical protein